MTFNDFGLAEPIVSAVAAEGYTTPTPIQTKAIPAILAGNDVLGCAQTGTGKTAAFALPVLSRLAEPRAGARRRDRRAMRGQRPGALVLCPTRELAAQIHESFTAYGRHLSLRHAVVFGGVSQAAQVRSVRAGTDVLVATPGRLLDLIGQGCVDLTAIEVLVLDEADRMLDMGFIRDIRRIIECVPRRRQTLLFSATMPIEIRRLADSILRDPVFVQAAPTASPVEAIAQSVYFVARKNKPALLERLLRHDSVERTLVFTRTKHGADKLARVLRRAGIEAGALHGNKSQGARTRVLDGFKSGRIPVLVATDVASRGIDVEEITHVINFDIPNVPETYVHRIGRTARAGASGVAMSLCGIDERDALLAIERLIDTKLHVAEQAADSGFDGDRGASRPGERSPSRQGRSDRRRRRRRGRPRSAAA